MPCAGWVVGSLVLLSCRAADPYPNVIPIGEVQGEPTLEGDATRHRSELLKETVRVRGVIHQLLRWQTSSGDSVHAVLIQNTRADSDRNPKTSDGLFVYTGQHLTLPLEASGEYKLRVGDKITVKGEVAERYGQTELSGATVLKVETGNFAGDLEIRELKTLPDRVWDRNYILEILEGMRVRLPKGLVTVTGTHPNNRTGDQQLWVVPPTHPVAQREDPAARRLYRPAHPLSHLQKALVQENGQYWVLGHHGAREVVRNSEGAGMPLVYAGSQITEPLAGGVVYMWGEYVVMPDRLPTIEDAGPAPSSLPAKDPESSGIRVAAYNVENLYDFHNDPFDGCDFDGDAGCPDVRKPYDYVPPSDERYRQRLRAIAKQIVEQLDSPDVILIQEVEDQDVASLQVDQLVYGQQDDADGELDALQELAIEIVAAGGPVYRTVIDRDGADARGITCAFMYSPETVRLVPPSNQHPLLGADPELPEGLTWMPLTQEASNPKAFNAEYQSQGGNPTLTQVFSRPVQLLQVERISDGQTLYVMNNHFSSGPDRRVERRTQQATLNALLAQSILNDDPDAWVISGGDLNVFPRPDDPLDPPSDQLGPLYEAGLFNVFDQVVSERPAEAYSYIYKGVVNTLDHLFVSPSAKQALSYAGYLKLNAAAPEALAANPPLRASDHDPVILELRGEATVIPDAEPLGEEGE